MQGVRTEPVSVAGYRGQSSKRPFTVAPNHYSDERPRSYHVPAPRQAMHLADPLRSVHGSYDVSVTISGDDSWSRRYVGDLEDGTASVTG